MENFLAVQPGRSTKPFVNMQDHERIPIIISHVVILQPLISLPFLPDDGILHRDTNTIHTICLIGHIRRLIRALPSNREVGGRCVIQTFQVDRSVAPGEVGRARDLKTRIISFCGCCCCSSSAVAYGGSRHRPCDLDQVRGSGHEPGCVRGAFDADDSVCHVYGG